MRTIITKLLITMAPLCALAQEGRIIRGNCTPDLDVETTATTRTSQRRVGTQITDWNPTKVYRQAVVLISFKDTDFIMTDPRATYDSIFNYQGYNNGNGPGCVAEYFQEQSGGLLNIHFDVYGPYKVPYNSKLNPKATASSSGENGRNVMIAATELWLAEDTLRSHKDYVWSGGNKINQVIYVHAGYSGNESDSKSYGHIWPNTGSFASMLTYDNYWVSNYSCSGELRVSDNSWGIGTICHEYSHSLGLPDIYPTNTKNSDLPYSVVDEWDLMDGGNFTNSGWCPPCYSGLERMLMGWMTPIELTEPVTITGMKPLSEGGPVYKIKHTDNEYYLLENRQWTGWDAGLPGKGLIIWHVDYNESAWSANSVNNTVNRPRYSAVNADNMDYNAWTSQLKTMRKNGLIVNNYIYQNPDDMNSYLLSTSAYPWNNSATGATNDRLTDNSTPASVMFNKNSAGSTSLSKAITNITISDGGLVSFNYMGGSAQPVDDVVTTRTGIASVYNLRGVCVGNSLEGQRPGIYIIRCSDGTARKVVVK